MEDGPLPRALKRAGTFRAQWRADAVIDDRSGLTVADLDLVIAAAERATQVRSTAAGLDLATLANSAASLIKSRSGPRN